MEVHVIQPQLNEAIFGAKTRAHLLHQAVVMQLANRRAGSAATKSKGFVRGGGKKPWRQKGTGRARAGSIRSPIWVGGGTTFGPQPRDYSYRMPRTARREALLSALSLKNRDGKIIVVDKFELEEAKTKIMVKALAELKVRKRFDRDCPSRREDRAFGAQSAEGQSAACRRLERLRSVALRALDPDRAGAQATRREVGGMKSPHDSDSERH